ncbi:protein ecdysoneless homolog isoform X2 [Amphibalanus amphitrite]|nr:protein ecdysoneless homolog isoform X2 [Amphibalanus amphitrite]XP_043244985.1 protein ecdysoneless homolog isoform X2 [Amphibalanus amphitrite]XP_043244986.1 protein ecdysoneless homolog isoform X2 [Amphibalanus amphitrite]
MAAVDAVRDASAATRADDKLQSCIQQKIDGYPGKITESHHRATVRTPAAAAALLAACPQLLPAAVQAFYLRDPIDLRACRAMRFFPPETCVNASVVFTKTLYAQLVHQQFRPDVRTGWQLPAPAAAEFRAADVGMKLACGLEILASRAGSQSHAAEADPTLDELRDDVRWQRYLSSLHQKRYFGDLLEGSKDHSALMEKARQYYIGHMLKEDRHSAPGDVVKKLLGTVKVDHAQWKKREAQLPPPDDDSWLEVSADQLEQLLQQQFDLQHQPPQQVAAELQEFLSQLSGLEGVESDSAPASRKSSRARKPSRKLSAAVMRKISTLSQASTASGMSTLSQKIDFNADSFTDVVRGMLDLGLDDDDWSDDDSSGMSSYGDEDESAELQDMLKGSAAGGDMKEIMAQMDDELRDSTLAESFVRATKAVRKESGASDASLDDVESFQPVDIDVNTVQNLLQSLQGQTASAGPAQTLLDNITKDKQKQ